MITRRQFAASSLAATSIPSRAAQQGPRPNVIYIILDDLGMYDTGCFGSKQIATPNIDRLAAEGMRFTEAYSGCTVCAPARCTLLTGKHMGHASVRANPGGVSLQSSDRTLSEMLKKAGYRCGGFGKWGVGDIDTDGVPEKKGFDRFFGYYHQVHAHYYFPDYLIDTGKKTMLAGNRGFYDSKPPAAAAFPATDPATKRQRQFSATRIASEMLAWIREQKGQPFFCYAPWSIPHGRHEILETDPAWQIYKDKPWPVEARVHAAFVSMADRFVGETMALLKELGLDANTLVFFSSDNGAAATYGGSLDSGGNLRGKKMQMYEGGIRVPFLARFPGRIQPGSTCNVPVYFPDLMPTIADFTNTREFLPAGIDGVSFAAVAKGEPAKGALASRHMYWEWNEDHFRLPYRVSRQACRKGNWKIVRDKASQPWELYDLSKDPGEQHDLAAANPKLVQALDAWVRSNRADPPEQVEPDKPAGQRWR
jgi:arylsulfatase A-like enzyme